MNNLKLEPSKLNKELIALTHTCAKYLCNGYHLRILHMVKNIERMTLLLHRKEVIQPHLPIRLPCYDFTPIIYPTLGGWLLTVTPPTSGVTNSRGVTGGVYKTRERIHRGMLIRDY